MDCSLDKLIQENEIKPNVMIKLILDISTSIKYLHNNNMIHRDLKPPNILINKKNGFIPKLSDFEDLIIIGKNIFYFQAKEEFDYLMSANYQSSNFHGTFIYASIEFFTNQEKEFNFSFKSDIFSLGLILYQLLTKKIPYQDQFELVKISKGEHTYPILYKIYNNNNKVDEIVILFLNK
jgi:serine/threonine protein kinase